MVHIHVRQSPVNKNNQFVTLSTLSDPSHVRRIAADVYPREQVIAGVRARVGDVAAHLLDKRLPQVPRVAITMEVRWEHFL